MDLPQTLRLPREGRDFVFQGGQVTFDSFVLALESLDRGQVLAVVVRGQDDVLLRDPGDSFVGIPVETLDLVRTEEFLLAGACKLLQAFPGFVELL
jgi:hypothetical protein